MNFRTLTSRQALATLGACFALLLLASPASADPDGYQPQLSNAGPDWVDRYLASHRAHEEQAYNATRTGIPDSVAAALEQAATAPTVIPYLSHGIGVTVGEDGFPVSEPAAPALREQPDGFQPQLRGVDSTPAVDSGFDWEATSFIAGGVLAALLLALMSTIALKERRGLRSA